MTTSSPYLSSPSPLSKAQHLRALLTLGLPLIGSQMAHAIVGVTDTLMLGWYGVEPLAAGVLGSSVFFVLFIMGSGFAYAVMPMVARAEAEGDATQARRATRMGLWLSLFYAVLVLPGMVTAGPILLALGQQPEVAALAETYLRIVGFGMAPALLGAVLKSYLSALNFARLVLWVSLGGALLNAGLNYLLIFGFGPIPELGVAGAALASATMHVVVMVALGVMAVRALPEHVLFQRLWRPDWEAFRAVFRLGWPIGLTHLAETGLFSITAIMMGWISTIHLAAHGIALQLATITFMVHIGLSHAATVRAGRAWGQRDDAALTEGAKMALVASAIFVALTMILFISLPRTLIGLFTDPTNPVTPQVIAVGVGLLAMAALFQLADAAQVMVLGLLRGVQDTRVPMVLAGFAYWAVGFPSSYVFGFVLGGGAIGVWSGLVVGLAVAALLLMYRFWVMRRWTHGPRAATAA